MTHCDVHAFSGSQPSLIFTRDQAFSITMQFYLQYDPHVFYYKICRHQFQ